MSVKGRSSRSRAVHRQNFITAIAGYSIILQDFFGARTGKKWLKNLTRMYILSCHTESRPQGRAIFWWVFNVWFLLCHRRFTVCGESSPNEIVHRVSQHVQLESDFIVTSHCRNHSKESTADRMSSSAILDRGLILQSKGKGWLFQDWSE